MGSRLLDEIVEFAGFNAGLELCRGWGGRMLYVPEKMHQDHPIALTIGLVAAQELARRFGGAHLEIPAERNALLELRNQAIALKYRAGASVSSLSEEYGIHRSMVNKVLDKLGVERRVEARA